jgi:hypothetical protein
LKREFIYSIILCIFSTALSAQPSQVHNLYFDKLATRWDEGVPLGNGILGMLVWQQDGLLRMSLDRADLWDLRPMKGLHRSEFSYYWIMEQVQKKEYAPVQKYFDEPYEREPAPTKIPGAALIFKVKELGEIKSVELKLKEAICELTWKNGTVLTTFIHATRPAGWFIIKGTSENITPELIAPKYEGDSTGPSGSVTGDDLSRLGYKNGEITSDYRTINYVQEGWGGFRYEVSVRLEKTADSIMGVWSISSHFPENGKSAPAAEVVLKAPSFEEAFREHKEWWSAFWGKSSLKVPDPLLEKQWYLEQYKFGAAARRGAPPISLQAVWTADNGRIPPWKGDFHHDLNTQLSYWPCYSSNHLEEGLSYLDYLDRNKPNFQRYTKQFFKTDGLAVPGVTTLDGTEMGGWIQYSLSPTISSWLAHHFYLHWRYSRDRIFLKKRAYPWISQTAKLIESLTFLDGQGKRKLTFSSSPEIYDNSLQAWFPENTNYDLALMKFISKTAAELAAELNYQHEKVHWDSIYQQFGDFAIDEQMALMFAPGLAYNQSHRHFSHAMAVHPLGLIKWEDGERSRNIIRATIAKLDTIGPSGWVGYSYAWLGNLKARAKDGEGALIALQIFARAFCSSNSFHLNGDQSGLGYSNFTYRPFTLEGNFAFAAGIQEMLLQSYAGFIEVFPAMPAGWLDVSFNKLRAEGAFLVSAKRTRGRLERLEIVSEKGGTTWVKLPNSGWKTTFIEGVKMLENKGNELYIKFKKDGRIGFDFE